jgi:hypothetical protein
VLSEYAPLHLASDFSIAARLELYCDKQFERNSMQSVLALGSVFGLLVTNYVSDHWGKRTSMLLIEAIAAVGFAGRHSFIQVKRELVR